MYIYVYVCIYLYIHIQGRIADWSPQIDSPTVARGLSTGGTPATPDSCSVYYLKAASDTFGCEIDSDYYGLSESTRSIIMQAGYVSEEVYNVCI